ncbi:AAA family ATPase [Schaalia vaccimaxillae]|uniref:AAA family ATPase n=1 Tax=Schaalia vaccimaxillae TaxID=183916 RepID=UPI001FB104BD|nr:AAA family ATPase [Schaalia vaccimaxillae]
MPRTVDKQLAAGLGISGAILLEGPRGCGKTMTGLHHSASAVFLDDLAIQEMLNVDPGIALNGQSPRLVDEWQLEPRMWNLVRRRVDALDGFGHFILTGSSVPDDDMTRHFGAARFLRIHQRTMTWYEKDQGEPTVSLEGLFNGDLVEPTTNTY